MIFSLISGSSGNSTLIAEDNTLVLLDCGTSGKKLTQAVESLGFSCSDIAAILITHEHSDHISGAGIMSRRFDIPIYLTPETFNAINIGAVKEDNIRRISPGKEFDINGIGVMPFSISHDAANPVGFSFALKEGKFSSLTDTGIVTQEIYNQVRDSKYIILESNHDVDMLQFGHYPYQLKRRILSDLGHLSNNYAAKMATKMMESGTEHIMLGHLSQENNTPEIAYKTVENEITKKGGIIGKDVTLSVANRYNITRLS